ncbi:MAG: nucleotidyl transferase AbiEii/AbiGii toxin family protein, partial [Anaerolineae bacterium]|nr:nucleotidyl transferase AbiEii/AbiGii toxin family protein [Anaerolineae bacterium]
MISDFLTPLQHAFLQRFFNLDVGQRFFLTGGTALAAFHLHHRISDDLDLFTLDVEALADVDREIESLAAELNCTIGRARRAEHFRQFLLLPQEEQMGPPLQVDLVHDVGPQYGE